jgi:hypothetical protein
MTEPIDSTERIRRLMVEETPHLVQQEIDAGREVWDSSAVRQDFTITGFMAPFVTATRKSDGQKGTLMFTHSPRFYFSWVPE